VAMALEAITAMAAAIAMARVMGEDWRTSLRRRRDETEARRRHLAGPALRHDRRHAPGMTVAGRATPRS
jgi:hypothetical protein